MLILNNYFKVVGFKLLNITSYIYSKLYRISIFIVQVYIHTVLYLFIQQIFQECIPCAGHCDRFCAIELDSCINFTFPCTEHLSKCHYWNSIVTDLKLEGKA